MTDADQPSDSPSSGTPDGGVGWHPAWCDLILCTADPAGQTGGYRPGLCGEHRSVPVRFDLSPGLGLSVPDVRDGIAWLIQACAPWPCDTYLRVQVGEMRLSLPAAGARQALDAVSALLVLAANPGAVSR